MVAELSNFIRRGGQGMVVLRSTARAESVKDVAPRLDLLRDRFAANLDRADIANADTLGRVIGDAFDPPLSAADMADLSADKGDVLDLWEARVASLADEWIAQPDRFEAARLTTEDDLLRAFAALANERRQAFLGITQYIWRSRDDERVRHDHAVHDDQVFDWEEPPEGGHPGMAFGCRCWAQPWTLPEEPYLPLTDAELLRLASDAEAEGQALATRDALLGVRDSILAIPGMVRDTARLIDLFGREQDRTISLAEAEELRRQRDGATARVDELLAVLDDPVGFAHDAWSYRARLSRAADDMTAAYLEGRATEAMVAAAHRDSGYADRSMVLGVAAALTALRLPSRRIADLDLVDREAVWRFWREASDTTPSPIGWDWEIRRNEGIQWGGPIRLQGDVWEDMLAGDPVLGTRLPRTFQTIDFFDRETGLVTSAKTLHTQGHSYVVNPSGITARLRGYLDKLATFEEGKVGTLRVRRDEIVSRRLDLAVPIGTTTEQMFYVQRAIDYARSRGVEMVVTRIE